jgi:transcriptional regulator with XRE-family HTH domain
VDTTNDHHGSTVSARRYGIMCPPARARGGVHGEVICVHRGTPTPEERQRLAATFGATLVAERGRRDWSQDDLAERVGCHRNTISLLERGERRPSTGMTWRLAKALRDDPIARVELDIRLRVLGGGSLVHYSRREHRRRERLAAQILARGGPAVPLVDGQDFDAYVSAILARDVA